MKQNPFRNIDTSSLSPEQLADAEAMAEYTRSHSCKESFHISTLAEQLLVGIISTDHRLDPEPAYELARKYAAVAIRGGEDAMQADFEAWKAARPTEPAPAPDELDVDDEDADGASVLSDLLDHVAEHETITRDEAVADTERRAQDESIPLNETTVV